MMDHLTAFSAECEAARDLAARGEEETGKALLDAAWLRFVLACQEERESQPGWMRTRSSSLAR